MSWTGYVAILSLALTLNNLGQVHSWLVTPHRTVLVQSRPTTSTTTSLASSPEGGTTDITGKDIYQRVFYRLSPFSEVDNHNAIVVEERVRFKPDAEKGEGYLKPVGKRTLIIRDGNVEEGEIGDELFELSIKESTQEGATHAGAGRDFALEAQIATILFLASNPTRYLEGNVLEVGCNTGIAGLLGSIGAGALKLHDKDGAPAAESAPADDILTIPKGTSLSAGLKSLTLSDDDSEILAVAAANIKNSNVPANKVSVEEINWRKRSLNRRSPKVYHTIIASDLNYNFLEAKELAHTVAHRLEALSYWESVKGDSKSPPSFVHVCPDDREELSNFMRFLTKGYRMNVYTGYLKVEKIIFVYQLLPESEPEEKLDDLEIEVQEVKERVYQSMTVQHHPDYADGAGEYFFPMETGEYDSSSASTYLEPESGGDKWY